MFLLDISILFFSQSNNKNFATSTYCDRWNIKSKDSTKIQICCLYQFTQLDVSNLLSNQSRCKNFAYCARKTLNSTSYRSFKFFKFVVFINSFNSSSRVCFSVNQIAKISQYQHIEIDKIKSLKSFKSIKLFKSLNSVAIISTFNSTFRFSLSINHDSLISSRIDFLRALINQIIYVSINSRFRRFRQRYIVVVVVFINI